MTLKTGVMIYLYLYDLITGINFNNISQFTVFYQINAAMVSIRNYLKNIKLLTSSIHTVYIVLVRFNKNPLKKCR